MDTLQQQIQRLEYEIKRQEAAVVRLEVEVRDLKRELAEFEARYDRIVAPVQAKLDAVRQAVDELEADRYRARFADAAPLESWTPPEDYVSVEEQYRRVWQTPTRETPAPVHKPRESVFSEDPETRLKRLYRKLARRYHPDYAAGEIDRDYRTKLMVMINEAYMARDVETLQLLADQQERVSPEEPLAALRLGKLRQASEMLQKRINELRTERDNLTHSDMMRLKVEEKLAQRKGKNLLRDLAAQLDQEYWGLVARLEKLRRGV